MSPLSRHTASAAWLGDAILAVIVPSDAATGITLIDLYWTILWIRALSSALLLKLDVGALMRVPAERCCCRV